MMYSTGFHLPPARDLSPASSELGAACCRRTGGSYYRLRRCTNKSLEQPSMGLTGQIVSSNCKLRFITRMHHFFSSTPLCSVFLGLFWTCTTFLFFYCWLSCYGHTQLPSERKTFSNERMFETIISIYFIIPFNLHFLSVVNADTKK